MLDTLTLAEAATTRCRGRIRRGKHGTEGSRGRGLRATHWWPSYYYRACARPRSGAWRCRDNDHRGERVNIHEYQAKEILRREGVPIPPGEIATTPAQVEQIARRLGGMVVVKAQVHAGGRGKAGGVKLAKTPAEAAEVGEENSRDADQGADRREGARHGCRRHRDRGVRRHHHRPRVQACGVHGEPRRRHRHRRSRRHRSGQDHAPSRRPALRPPAVRGDGDGLLPVQGHCKGARGRAHHAAAVPRVHRQRSVAGRDQPAGHHTRR